jgi:hypothetical protein
MVYCSICHAHGLDEKVCKSHANTSWRKCVYHPRYSGDDKQPITVACEPCSVDDLPPDVSAALPRTPHRAPSQPRPDAAVGSAMAAPLGSAQWTGSEILAHLFSNDISKEAAQQLLILRMAAGSTDSDERDVLRSLLPEVRSYSFVAPEARAEDVGKAAQELLLLQQRNGKRVGMLMATHRRIYADLHLKNPRASMQQVYKNSETGEAVVTAEAAQDVSDATVLHMVLVDFIYVCTAYMLLTATEGRGLHKWVCRQLWLRATATPVIIYRAIVRLLQHLDEADIGKDLQDIIDTKSDAFLNEETAIALRSTTGGPGVHSPHAPTNNASSTCVKGDLSLPVPWPRPNICFNHTNGHPCTDLDDTGKCKYSKLHNVCGVRFKEGGKNKFWTGAHRGVDCPHNTKH